MVCIMLRFIRAERDGIWLLHLSALAEMLPYFHAYDHTNYARWVPVYLADMHRLPETAPAVHQEFVAGNFPVKGSDKPFNQVWTDLNLEQSLNRHSKTSGGLIGMTQNQGATDKWHLTASDRAKIAELTKELCGLCGTHDELHREEGKIRLKRDEADVEKLTSYIVSFGNPFKVEGGQLQNLLTGVVATTDVTSSLLQAPTLGKDLVEKFVATRFNDQELTVFQPISKQKPKTFASLKKATTIPLKEKSITLSAERSLFGRLIVISQKRRISLPELFEHELSVIPWSIAKSDGSLAKCNKSVMLDELEKYIPEPRGTVLSEDVSTCCIVDSMAVVQMYKYGGCKTFGNLADKLSAIILNNFEIPGCQRIDSVFDRYDRAGASIKSGERSRRSIESGVKQQISGKQTQITIKWERFISETENKRRLVKFLGEQWVESVSAKLKRGQQFVIAGGMSDPSKSMLVESDRVAEVTTLNCRHEEADTRMLFHAANAVKAGFQRIVIVSPDTLLMVHFAEQIGGELWFKLSRGGRLFPAHIIARNISEPVLCQALPAFHALTGCDTTSSFVRQGKLKPWRLLVSNATLFGNIAKLGAVPLDSIIDLLDRYVASIYHGSPTTISCNALRYKMFATRGIQNEALPPTRNTLTQHVCRADYQVRIWREALNPSPTFVSPEGNGWEKGPDGTLQPILSTKAPMPDSVIELVKCHCSISLCSGRCSCKAAELPCTTECPCEGEDSCKNPFKHSAVEDTSSSEEESDYETNANK